MATPADQLDQIVASTWEQVKPVLNDNITTKNALLAALESKSSVRIEGGRELKRPILYALNDTVGSFSGWDTINTDPQDGFGDAVYTWRRQGGSIVISGEDLDLNNGREQIFNLLTAKIEQLMVSVETDFNTQLWADGTGNGGKDFLGVQAIVDDTSILGGIDPATETWWKSHVEAGPADLTDFTGIELINNVLNTLQLANSKPDFLFTTQVNYEAIDALAIPNIRFTDTKMADLGFEAVAHRGAQIVFESASPAGGGGADGGPIWFINSNFLEFVKHSRTWLKRTPMMQPVNQDGFISLIVSSGNLITGTRRAHGVITETVVV
jgi:hypothetical protein